MGDINIVQRITDAASVNGQTYPNIQADAQGRVDAHAISGIHSIIPASGDLIIGAAGTWVKFPKGTDNRVLRMINGVVTWDMGNGILSFIPNVGDLIIGGSGSWDRLTAGSDDQIIKMVSGIPAWVQDASTDKTVIGQWALVRFLVNYKANLGTPVCTIGSITFNANGTVDLWEIQKGGNNACYGEYTVTSFPYSQTDTGVFKLGNSYDVVVSGNVAMLTMMDVAGGAKGNAEIGILLRGISVEALKTIYEASVCTDAVPTGAIRGVLVHKPGTTPVIANSVATAVTWDASVYDMTPAFWNVSDPTKITIPYGVSQVKLYIGAQWTTSAVGDRVISVTKNDGYFPGSPADRRPASATSTLCTAALSSPIIPVVEGDYFRVVVLQNSGGDLSFGNDGNLAYFGVEVIA